MKMKHKIGLLDGLGDIGFYLSLLHNLILLKMGLKMDYFAKWIIKKIGCGQIGLTSVLSPKIKPNKNEPD